MGVCHVVRGKKNGTKGCSSTWGGGRRTLKRVLKQSALGRQRVSLMPVRVKCIPGRDHKCQGPEVGVCLAGLRIRQESRGTGMSKGQSGGGEAEKGRFM